MIIRYTTENGGTGYLTPETDSTLKDATSITDYGQREYTIDAGDASVTAVAALARAMLAVSKDPQYRLGGDVSFRGYLRAKGGGRVPASEVRAGERIRILNYRNTDLVLLLTSTNYSDIDETVSVNTGSDVTVDTLLAMLMPKGSNTPRSRKIPKQ